MNVWMYRKRYLIARDAEPFLVGGPPSSYSLEESDWDILRLLSEDARMSFSEIARKLSTPESTVRYRLDQLERSGLVAGYRVELSLARLGMMFFKAQLYLTQDSRRAPSPIS